MTTEEEIKAIGNKTLRQEMYHKWKKNRAMEKRANKIRIKALRAKLGEEAVPKGIPNTYESRREHQDDMITDVNCEDLKVEDLNDNYTEYYKKKRSPKVLITSTFAPKKRAKDFLLDLRRLIPNSYIRSRKQIPLTEYANLAARKGFTDLIVCNNDTFINSILLAHLPHGPTIYFRISGIETSKSLKVAPYLFSSLQPEIFLNNFVTRLGHTVSRILGSIFPYTPNFHGRRAVTIHNQRDYIFFRHHVYEFDSNEKVRVREMGPRFTLKVIWIKTGMMSGDYMFMSKKWQYTNKATCMM